MLKNAVTCCDILLLKPIDSATCCIGAIYNLRRIRFHCFAGAADTAERVRGTLFFTAVHMSRFRFCDSLVCVRLHLYLLAQLASCTPSHEDRQDCLQPTDLNQSGTRRSSNNSSSSSGNGRLEEKGSSRTCNHRLIDPGHAEDAGRLDAQLPLRNIFGPSVARLARKEGRTGRSHRMVLYPALSDAAFLSPSRAFGADVE